MQTPENFVVDSTNAITTPHAQQLLKTINDFFDTANPSQYQEIFKKVLESHIFLSIKEETHDPYEIKNIVYLSNNLMQFISKLHERANFINSNTK